MSATPANPPARPPYPVRFSWPMRLFLAFLLFDMFFRGISVCYNWSDWADELDMRLEPIRMPTRAEIEEMAARRSEGQPDPVREEFMRAFDSVWEFFKPWPEPAVRAKLHTWTDTGKWAHCWLASRLTFFENLVGTNQEWAMFSPGAGKKKWVARARLVYSDGTHQTIRGKCDPEDLTCYSHWFEEKILDHELKVKEGRNRTNDALGYCNLLSHRHARNEAGAELVKIYLYLVRYDLPPPDVDAREWLKNQSGPPKKQVYADFYSYDVRKRHGKCLIHSYE